MAVYDESVFQFGTGGVGTGAFEDLDGVHVSNLASEGVWIRNIDDGGATLLVNVSSTGSPDEFNSLRVLAGQEVHLKIDEPFSVVVKAYQNGCDYTWYAV
jgi:hypothetical protein